MKDMYRALIGNRMHSQMHKEAQTSFFKEDSTNLSLPYKQPKCYHSVPGVVNCMRLRLSAKQHGISFLCCRA